MIRHDARMGRSDYRARIRLVLVVAATVLTGARQVTAEDVESLLREGVRQRQQGRDREALATFQRAGAIQRLPRVVAQIGFAEQAMGLWPAAAEHVEEALAATGDEWIQKNRRTLEQSFERIRTQVGRLEVWGSPDGAEVLLDGRSVGHLPDIKPLWVGVDPARLIVRAPGFAEVVRLVEVRAGDLRREHIELRLLSLAAPVGVAAGGASAVGGVVTKPAVVVPSEGHAPAQVPMTRRWWFWTAIAAIVVGAGVAVGVTLSRGVGACDGIKRPCTVYPP
jgi:hypothetical protein